MVDYIINAGQPFNMMETYDFSGTMQRNFNPNLEVGMEILLKEIL